MKKVNCKLAISSLMMLCFLLTRCVCSSQTGDSEKVKEERKVSEFSAIGLAISGNVYITQGDTQQLIVEGPADIIQELKTEVEGNTLEIKFKDWFTCHSGKLNIYITIPKVKGLYLSGSGNMISENKIKTDDIDLKVSGSGNIEISNLMANAVTSKISGSGNIKLGGEGIINSHDIKISGSGDVLASGLAVNDYNIAISGSGGCDIKGISTLNVRISGSGKVKYSGSPKIDAEISGSGKVIAE